MEVVGRQPVADRDKRGAERQVADTRERRQVEGSRARADRERTQADQRARLLAAMGETVAREGYRQAKIGEIAARAGVSRATFYELFTGKQECFLAVHDQLAQVLTERIAEAVSGGDSGGDGDDSSVGEGDLSASAGNPSVGASDPGEATQRALSALVDFAQREPGAFTLLTHEAMLAGNEGWQARARLFDDLARIIEEAWEQTGERTKLPDVPARVLVGAAVRLLGIHMRRGERDHTALLHGLGQWAATYEAPVGERRWTRLTSHHAASKARVAVGTTPHSERRRAGTRATTRAQRERILRASAEVVYREGGVDVSVADIAGAAEVSREAFYRHFADKRDALLATQALTFERLAGACTRAFYDSDADWPVRLWDTAGAFADCILAAPAEACLFFVHSYALGPEGARRIDDGLPAFSQFLQAGFQAHGDTQVQTRGDGRADAPSDTQTQTPPGSVQALTCEALCCAILEVTACLVQAGRTDELQGLLPAGLYLCLTPVVGWQAAGELADRKTPATTAGRFKARAAADRH